MEDRLQKFVRLIDAGNFTKAARDMHISQPALSVAIAKLERELHAPLLVHGVRPITLTSAGKLAYAAGKELQVKTNNLKLQLAELAHQKMAVSVGMIDSVASTLFTSSESVDELERNASVSLVVDNSRNLLQAVEKGELDLAFVTEQQRYAATLEVLQSAAEPLVVVCHPALQTQVNQAVKAGTLPYFISYNQASATHRLVMDALQHRAIVSQPTFYSTSPEVMLRMVLLQKGVAALPWLAVRDHLAVGDLAFIGRSRPLHIERPIVALKRRDTILCRPLSRTAQQVGVLLAGITAEVESFMLENAGLNP